MSANVLGCGAAHHLMEVHEYQRMGHIHVHNLSTADDLKTYGVGRSELCCHGCGESVLILFVATTNTSPARDNFANRHKQCFRTAPKRDKCSNYRSQFFTQDLRDQHPVVVQKEVQPAHG